MTSMLTKWFSPSVQSTSPPGTASAGQQQPPETALSIPAVPMRRKNSTMVLLQPSTTSNGGGGGGDDLSDRHFGLENYGNTCYCNAVLQSLYFCRPFRDRVFTTGQSLVPTASQSRPPSEHLSTLNILYNMVAQPLGIVSRQPQQQPQQPASTDDQPATVTLEPSLQQVAPASSEDILSNLKDLFFKIHSQRKKTGSVTPEQFVRTLRQQNEMFRSPIHHDAHEFLNYLVNCIADILQVKAVEYDKFHRSSVPSTPLTAINLHAPPFVAVGRPADSDDTIIPVSQIEKHKGNTWIHDLFGGLLANEIRCLTCDTLTHRMEPFLDLSLDIPADHVSLTSLIKHFCRTEILSGRNKFYCDACGTYQEAEKRLKIHQLPRILVVHLKRFKYVEKMRRYVKLLNRVSFPLELRLQSAEAKDKPAQDITYGLSAVVAHIGTDPSHGHYISIVKSMKKWWVFDDHIVEPVDESQLAFLFGRGTDTSTGEESAGMMNNRLRQTTNQTVESLKETFDKSNPHTAAGMDDPIYGYGSMDGSVPEDTAQDKRSGAGLLPAGSGYILFYETINTQ
eukprot:Partr_v1_DN27279_c1_g1_i1_m38457 putative ubiquitin carboxyl-terminal hydrolase